MAGASQRADARERYVDGLVAYVAIALVAVSIGWLAGVAWRHLSTAGRLWAEASEQRYLIMAGETGPVTYLVTQHDFDAFERAALTLDGVLGVEIQRFPDVVAVAFASVGHEAIDTLGQLPYVSDMRKKFVPMSCHREPPDRRGGRGRVSAMEPSSMD